MTRPLGVICCSSTLLFILPPNLPRGRKISPSLWAGPPLDTGFLRTVDGQGSRIHKPVRRHCEGLDGLAGNWGTGQTFYHNHRIQLDTHTARKLILSPLPYLTIHEYVLRLEFNSYRAIAG